MNWRAIQLLASLLFGAFLALNALADPPRWRPMAEAYNGLFLQTLIAPTLQNSEVRWHAGDDPRWARPDFDDSGWDAATLLNVPSRTGVYWLRFRVRDTAGSLPAGCYVQATMAYDLYWDGAWLGRSGVAGNSRAEEQPGPLDNLYYFPAGMRGPGEHVVAMRVSNYWNRFPQPTMPMRFVAIDPPVYQAFITRGNVAPTLAIGATLMLAVTAVVMWIFAARRAVLLVFAAMCVAAATMQATLVARFVYGYTYEWHYWAWRSLGISGAILGACLLALVVVHFRLGARWWTLVMLPLAFFALPAHLAGVPGPNIIVPVFFGLALLATIVAACRGGPGAWFIAAGLALTVLLWAQSPRHLLSNKLFQYVVPTIVGLTIAIALDVRGERRQARQAQLTAARLELELLKKNIQPHFLINTLATIQEVIEREPRTAAALIDALTSEFRILARVSGEKLIPLAQELALCRAHLDVMTLRKGARCSLDVRGVDEEALVPPALFHTLIENGLTHLLPRDGRLEFELRAEYRGDVARYALLAIGRRQGTAEAGLRPRDGLSGEASAQEGTGLRYIKARLEESFTGRWSVLGGPVPEGWETVIEIGGAGRSSASPLSAAGTSVLTAERPA